MSPGTQGVSLAQGDGVEAQGLGHAVHVRLGREHGLRRAEAPEGAAGRRVRHHDPAVDADVVAAVGAGRVEAAAREHDRAQRAVGAAVEEDVDLHRGDPAVARDAGAVADERGVALGGGGHVLEAVVDELHRPPRLQRQQRRVPGDDRGVVLLAAEAPARLRLDDAHLLVGKAQQPHQGLVHVVRALERAVDRHPVGGRDGDDAVRLDVDVLLAAGAVLALDHEVGLGEAAGEVALLDRDLLEDPRRSLGVEDGRSRPVLEAHLGRAQRVAVLVGEEEDRLLGVAHLAFDEVGLVVLDERDDVAAGDVAVIDDGEAGAVEVEVDGRHLAAPGSWRGSCARAASPGSGGRRRSAPCRGPCRGPPGGGRSDPRRARAKGTPGDGPQAPRSWRQTRRPCRLR